MAAERGQLISPAALSRAARSRQPEVTCAAAAACTFRNLASLGATTIVQ